MPNRINKKLKRVSRLVVLPDYQGIGIGTKLIEFIGKEYTKQGFTFIIVTSTPSLLHYFNKSNNWKCYRKSIVNSKILGIEAMRKTLSSKRITTSWKYVL